MEMYNEESKSYKLTDNQKVLNSKGSHYSFRVDDINLHYYFSQ